MQLILLYIDELIKHPAEICCRLLDYKTTMVYACASVYCNDACRGSGGGERNQGEEAEVAAAAASEAGNGSQLVMPEDGYEWKKYGQKFIKNIQKIRYFFRLIKYACLAFLASIGSPRCNLLISFGVQFPPHVHISLLNQLLAVDKF